MTCSIELDVPVKGKRGPSGSLRSIEITGRVRGCEVIGIEVRCGSTINLGTKAIASGEDRELNTFSVVLSEEDIRGAECSCDREISVRAYCLDPGRDRDASSCESIWRGPLDCGETSRNGGPGGGGTLSAEALGRTFAAFAPERIEPLNPGPAKAGQLPSCDKLVFGDGPQYETRYWGLTPLGEIALPQGANPKLAGANVSKDECIIRLALRYNFTQHWHFQKVRAKRCC